MLSPHSYSLCHPLSSIMSADTLQHHLVQPYKSIVNKTSEEYKRNYEEWQPIVAELYERLEEATAQGKEKHIKLHKKRGQLLGMSKRLYQMPCHALER